MPETLDAMTIDNLLTSELPGIVNSETTDVG